MCYLSTMSWLVQIFLWLFSRMWHSSGITTHNIKVCTCGYACFSVPLNLENIAIIKKLYISPWNKTRSTSEQEGGKIFHQWNFDQHNWQSCAIYEIDFWEEMFRTIKTNNIYVTNFSWTSIHHWWRKYGQNRVIRIKNSIFQDRMMLFYTNRKWYVILFCPTSQRVKQ